MNEYSPCRLTAHNWIIVMQYSFLNHCLLVKTNIKRSFSNMHIGTFEALMGLSIGLYKNSCQTKTPKNPSRMLVCKWGLIALKSILSWQNHH